MKIGGAESIIIFKSSMIKEKTYILTSFYDIYIYVYDEMGANLVVSG